MWGPASEAYADANSGQVGPEEIGVLDGDTKPSISDDKLPKMRSGLFLILHTVTNTVLLSSCAGTNLIKLHAQTIMWAFFYSRKFLKSSLSEYLRRIKYYLEGFSLLCLGVDNHLTTPPLHWGEFLAIAHLATCSWLTLIFSQSGIFMDIIYHDESAF